MSDYSQNNHVVIIVSTITVLPFPDCFSLLHTVQFIAFLVVKPNRSTLWYRRMLKTFDTDCISTWTVLMMLRSAIENIGRFNNKDALGITNQRIQGLTNSE